jgi:hypothetical protein
VAGEPLGPAAVTIDGDRQEPEVVKPIWFAFGW